MNFKFFKGQSPNYDRHNTIWKTSTGRHIPIDWMTTNHIINVLDCLNGIGLTEIPDFYQGKNKQEWIGIFTTELRIRHVGNHQTV